MCVCFFFCLCVCLFFLLCVCCSCCDGSESSCRSLDMWPSTQEEDSRRESDIPPALNQNRTKRSWTPTNSWTMPCSGLLGFCQYETNKLVRIQSLRLGSMKWSLNGFILLFIWWVNMWNISAPASLCTLNAIHCQVPFHCRLPYSFNYEYMKWSFLKLCVWMKLNHSLCLSNTHNTVSEVSICVHLKILFTVIIYLIVL